MPTRRTRQAYRSARRRAAAARSNPQAEGLFGSTYAEILAEEMAKQHQCPSECFLAAMQRALCLGLFDDPESVRSWKDGMRFVESANPDTIDFTSAVAELIRGVETWDCTDDQAMRALRNLRAVDTPSSIIEAFRLSACTSQTAATEEERSTLGVHCCHAHAAAPDPEPQSRECQTCCEPFAPDQLVTCAASEECDYAQCVSCIVKGGGGVCPRVGCMYVHFKCPACRQVSTTQDLALTDERFTKDHVLQILDSLRVRFRNKFEQQEERLDEIMNEFTDTMSVFAEGFDP